MTIAQVLTPYIEFAKKAFSREATYRVEVFTNIGSVLVRVYLLRMLWTALYKQNAVPDGISLSAIVTYSTIALLMSLVLEVDGTRMIRDKLREGGIATDLMKPISLPFYFFSDGIGMTLLHAVMIVPALLLALFIVHIDIPAPGAILAFIASCLLGYLVNFMLNFLMNLTAFWTLETFAVQLMVRWISDLLSGQVIPLLFFPGILQQIVLALPFAAIYSTPLLIYVGAIKPEAYGMALAVQAAWFVGFAGLATLMWRAAQQRVVVQGG